MAHMHPYSRPGEQYPVGAPPPPIPSGDGTLPPISNGSAQDSYSGLAQYPHAPSQTINPDTDPLAPYQGRKGDYTYSLVVAQQPVRARMCGFGDKDRRPITPPPCIRLIVFDTKANKEVNYSEIDSSYFVLTVDLVNAQGTQEVNIVRSQNSAGHTMAISQSPTAAYPGQQDPHMYIKPEPQMYVASGYDTYGQPVPSYPAPQHQMAGGYYQSNAAPPAAYPPPPPAPSYQGAPPPGYPAQYGQQYHNPPPHVPMGVPSPPTPSPQQAASAIYTRNLIGSLAVNASKLNDVQKKLGLWFVLQDLSVRTEGQFRLKMNFVDVGSGQNNGHVLNKGRADVLATCFSEPFQVYSAKKFPGVIESTALSKVFATQGIKIPIRKDAPKTIPNQQEYDADDM
ncbi:hypothetical protein M011DRAFT_303656 [Sporormia fimetaria CBS 119925]|uniref:Velvet domain-containing protein n=1 Tax=Sporormia fimetaria CBS 119925 TaxID=1340428 RepID=A0A6A6VID8_9PLEO|nr:hypothetical protein M011DRAFT_303656 [Sporormia fimetaria CBS 119925]